MNLLWLAPSEWMNPEFRARSRDLWRLPELACLRSLLVEQKKLSLFLVGGAVRDLLLERTTKDLDLLVSCSPQELWELRDEIAQTAGVTVFPLDRERGYLRVCSRDSDGVDLAALDSPSLWHDLRRRDLTFNAMALDVEGRLADPFSGRQDLQARRVRVVDRDVLVDDPLRILRCLRMAAALDFRVQTETLEMARELAPRLEQTAGERILEEFRRFAEAAKPPHWEAWRRAGLWEAVWNLDSEELPWGWLRQWWRHRRTPHLFSLLAALLWQVEPRESCLQRLRPSRELVTACRRWWQGCDILAAQHPQTARQVHHLLCAVKGELPGLLDFADLPAFAHPLTPALETRLLRDASEQGELRWTPLPLDGKALCQHWQREPGPWLKEMLNELSAAWACGEADSVEQLLAHSEAIWR